MQTSSTPWVTELLQHLDKFPPSFWGAVGACGAVIAACIALTGVLVANAANMKRLRAELKARREETDRGRELLLRKEIFMLYADGIAVSERVFGDLMKLDQSLEAIQAERRKHDSTQLRLEVVAGLETIKAARAISDHLDMALLRLAVPRAELMNLTKKFHEKKEGINELQREADELLKKADLAKRAAPANQASLLEMTSRLTEIQGKLQALADEMMQIGNAAIEKMNSFAQDAIRELVKFQELVPNWLFAVRTELELPFDQAGFRAVFSESQAKILASANESLRANDLPSIEPKR